MSEQPADFRAWLLLRANESSDVGHLACDVRDDEEWPEGQPESFARYQTYLRSQGALPEALAALEIAWSEYRASRI